MDGEFSIAQLDSAPVPPEMQAFWREHGYIVLKHAAPQALIERINEVMARHRAASGETKDAQGFVDRVGMLHQRSDDCLRLAAQPNVMTFLRWALDDDPLLMGSLNFERGTQQDAHIDSIFFYTEPAYAMCGVWYALEDVQGDAGPLFYLDGSHNWDFIRGEQIVETATELREEIAQARAGKLPEAELAGLVSRLNQLWARKFQALIDEKATPKTPVLIQAGDCLIWHAHLGHGGLPRENAAHTRRSMVFHYIGRNARLYSEQEFMLRSNAEILRSPGMALNTTRKPKVAPGLDFIKFNYTTRIVDGEQVYDSFLDRASFSPRYFLRRVRHWLGRRAAMLRS